MDAVASGDVSQRRTEYNTKAFTEDQLSSTTDPFKQFHVWFQEALSSIPEPQAVCVSTATKDGKPSSRMVLMKKYDESGFAFFTNYTSRKAQEIEANPNACMLFYWESLHRQVRIEGRIHRTSEAESAKYFSSRPRISQASACASNQSSEVESRQVLEDRQKEVLDKYPDSIPKPDHWGGYVLEPSYFEFWIGQSSRLHDRITFTKQENGQWQRNRLAP